MIYLVLPWNFLQLLPCVVLDRNSSVVLKEAGHVLLSWVVYTVLNLQALESGHMDSHTCSQAGAIRSASECISIKKH